MIETSIYYFVIAASVLTAFVYLAYGLCFNPEKNRKEAEEFMSALDEFIKQGSLLKP